MKKAFSLLELIFAIVIIAIIASFAVPKFLDTRNTALVSTIKRDVTSATSAIQSYHLVNGEIEKISDAITLNSKNWTLTDKKAVFKDGSDDCLTMEIKTQNSSNSFDITISKDVGTICKDLANEGIVTISYTLF